MPLTRRVHRCTIFQTFEYSNESSPNSSGHFWNHKVRVSLNFASIFQCHERWLLCIFVAQTSYTLNNNSSSKWNFRTFEWLGENSPNSYVIFETISQFFFRLCITVQYHEITLLYFFRLRKETKQILNMYVNIFQYTAQTIRDNLHQQTFEGMQEIIRK